MFKSKMVIFAVFMGCCLGIAHAEKPQSEALTLARAGGMKHLRDVSEKDLKKALQRSTDRSDGASVGLAIGTASGVFTPPPGISSGAATGLLVASVLLPSGPEYERRPRFLIWMPKTEAQDSRAAVDRFRDILMEAIHRAFPERSTEIVTVQGMPASAIRMRDSSGAGGDLATYPIRYFPKELDAPALLGGYAAYVWAAVNGGFGDIAGYPMSDPTMTSTDRIEFFRKLSAELPEWASIYLPPDEKFAPYPQVLKKGEVLLFVEPGLIARVSTLPSESTPPANQTTTAETP